MPSLGGSLDRLFENVTRRPPAVLALVALVVGIAGAGLFRLELRTDGRALVPLDDPVVRFDREVREHFGLRDPIVVVVETEHPDGIYNAATLTRIREITEAVLALDGIEPEAVTSLATEKGDRVYPSSPLRFRPLLDPPTESARDVERVRGDVEGLDILEGTLVSLDRRSSAILVGVPLPEDRASFDRGEILGRVEAAARPLAGEDRVVVVGAPAAEALLGDHLLADLARILPVALFVVALVLFVGSRRIWGAALGLVEVGAAQIFTFGMMGWAGVPVYLTTAVLPVILTTLGLADEIHVFWRHQQVLARPDGPSGRSAVRVTLGEMARPLTLTSLTTGLGFLSFLASPLEAVRIFGLFAAVGIAFCLAFSFTAVPAALVLLGDDRLRRPAGRPANDAPRLVRWLAPALRRRRMTLATLGVVTALFVAGIPAIVVQDGWIDGFAPESSFRRAVERVNEDFFGTHLLLVHLELPPLDDPPQVLHGEPGPLVLRESLASIGRFEEFLREQAGVGGVLGPPSHLLGVAYLRHGRQESMREIPELPMKVAELWNWFDTARGEHRRREVVDDAKQRAVVTVFLENANYRDTATLLRAIDDYAAEHLEPKGMAVDFAGDVAVSQAMIPAIVRTQVASLLFALAGALLVVAVVHRSLASGLVILAPACLGVAWVFGLMGWLGIPLGVATSMFCAITLGVGVDYAVHFHHAWRTARDAGDPRPAEKALAEAGPAVLADTIAIALGFGLLAVSQVPANARLGLLVAAALVASAVITLVPLAAYLDRRATPERMQ